MDPGEEPLEERLVDVRLELDDRDGEEPLEKRLVDVRLELDEEPPEEPLELGRGGTPCVLLSRLRLRLRRELDRGERLDE